MLIKFFLGGRQELQKMSFLLLVICGKTRLARQYFKVTCQTDKYRAQKCRIFFSLNSEDFLWFGGGGGALRTFQCIIIYVKTIC